VSQEIFSPADEIEAGAVVASARALKRTLDITGGGTRAGFGRPREGWAALSTTKMSGIVFHEPSEMTIRAKGGTPLKDVVAALDAKGQMLPFEPGDPRVLWGSEGEPTIGALVAVNASGPRRISAGAARDSLIGVRFVNGAGEAISSGGRVMKNVTGLDLVKLTAGAHGTLGLVTEATFKVLPKPEAEATVVMRRLDDSRAVAAMALALGSPFGVSGAATLGPGMGREWPRTFVRVEGFADQVKYRSERLIAALADFGAKHALEGEDSAKLWRAVRDVAYLAPPRGRAIWRVSLAPSHGPEFVAKLGAKPGDYYFDWGGGLVWLASEASLEACVAVRAALAPLGGHATLMRAPDALRAAADVFQPLGAVEKRLTLGVKAACDPNYVFNRGRMFRDV